MFKRLFLTGLLIFGISTSVFARGDSIAYEPIERLDELAADPTASTDFIPAYDASAKKDVKIDVSRFTFNAAANAFTGDSTHTGAETFGKVGVLTETATTSSADPGIVTASLTAPWTAMVSDDTGTLTDTMSLSDGFNGQIKYFTLKTDGEAAGLALTPVNFIPGTDILFEDINDSCILIFDAGVGGWTILANNGGTVR